MRKTTCRLWSLWLALAVAFTASAEIPEGYYDDAIGKKGEALQRALATILNQATNVGYDGLYEVYRTSDVTADGTVWDMYSSTTHFTFSQKCGSYSGEGSCFNREHSVPQSWFGSGLPKSDAWLVYPTDGYVNNRRGNYVFAEVGSATYSSNNGFSKVGSPKTPGCNEERVFEPNDMYKGDFARAYFYAATRYASSCGSWRSGVFTSSFPHLGGWTLPMLLRWNELDPVSEKEINRNEAVYASRQHNRNPFIDYPELVEYIFGSLQNEAFYPSTETTPYLTSPTRNTTVTFDPVSINMEGASETTTLKVQGRHIESDVTLTVSGANAVYFTVTPAVLSAQQVLDGTNVTLTYAPDAVGQHTALLTLAGGGMSNEVPVNLVGSGVDTFMALPATSISDVSFLARWTPKRNADDYELDVWYDDYSESAPETVLADIDFTKGAPSDWTTSGYTAKENLGFRLASSSQPGTLTSPAYDLSASDVSIEVVSAPYNKDESVLTVSIDGNTVSEITYDGGEVTSVIPVTGGTATSKITFSAQPKLRVHIKSVRIKSGGNYKRLQLAGYPKRVGDVQSYKVEELSAITNYYYTVTPYIGDERQEPSGTIKVLTAPAAITGLETDVQNALIYADGDKLCIDGAPANARLTVYTVDGRIHSTRLVHGEWETVSLTPGVYIVKLTGSARQQSVRVLIR